MDKSNAQKQKEIEAILAESRAKLFEIRKKRDAAVNNYVDKMKQERIDTIKKSLNDL